MKWLFLVLIPFAVEAQKLKPGIYKGLRPDKPVMLGKGEYIFMNLEMKNLGTGIWLDGRKASRVTLLNCCFEGNGKGTGIKSGQDLNVENCTFRNMEYGIMLVQPLSIKKGKKPLAEAMVSITANEFANNREAIRIARPKTNLANFRCNEFIDELAAGNLSVARIGLHIGVEPGNTGETATGALSGAIGWDGVDDHADPSGNVWPVDAANSTTPWPIPPGNTDGVAIMAGWVSPANWTSLQNDNPNTATPLEYWAFNNEFVRNVGLNTPTNTVLKRSTSGEQIMMYRTGIPNPPVNNPGVVVYRGQCTTDLPDVFPLRMAVTPVGNLVNSTIEPVTGNGLTAVMGDAIPNPASSRVTIPLFIPELSDKAYILSVFDLSGKKIFTEVSIHEIGKTLVDISLTQLPAGVYGYSLRESGKVLGTRKLVVIK